ncbi:MAG: CBS domain-containing protein [Methylobacteriaceae bacterium]|nr:CBS domain-containing protein [Methylobacteriaceae bacterium]
MQEDARAMVANAYSTPLSALDAVVLDTETTGLDARTARLVQIGAVRIHGERIDETDVFDVLVNPGTPIPPESTKVHGIADSDVAGAPRFAEVEPKLTAFLGASVIVGHTLTFDMAMLKREFGLADRPWRAPRMLDVRWLARVASPTLAHYDLDGLCSWLGVSVEGRHTGLGDALATARVFGALIPLLRQRNIRTFAEAAAACRRITENEARGSGGMMVVEAPVIGDQQQTLARIDSFPYRHRVRDVMTAPPLTIEPTQTVGDAVALLAERKISSVFVRIPEGGHGIFTERDVLRLLHEKGAEALAIELGAVAATPLVTVHENAFVYRAIGRMTRLNLRHLGVRNDAGELVGALTPRNLLRQRATSAIVLGDEIDSAPDVAVLGRAWAKLAPMAASLLEEDVEPLVVAQVISSEICILTRRAAQLAEARMAAASKGGPPVRYCVMVLGSAGRGESLLAADQDNAIVYEKGERDGPEDAWFAELAGHMTTILDTVGVPLCKGGVMATNPLWRHSLEGWYAQVDGWVRRQNPQDLLNVDIFFDGVPVHGDHALGEAAWAHAYRVGARAPDFVKLLAVHAGDGKPPFTLFGGLRTDEKGRVDIKKHGLMPIFTAARALSIRHDVRERATPARLRGVQAKGVGAPEEYDALVAAQAAIVGAMLAQQLADTEQGVPLSTRVNPDGIPKKAKAALIEALKKVSIAADLVTEGRA